MYYIHGENKTRLHKIWESMKCRCLNANHPSYQRYGARGIKIQPEWQQSYVAFRDWAMANGYSSNLELDRIDVNGNYTPDNCRWVTHYEQTLNRRDTLYILIDGKKEKLRTFCLNNHISVNSVNNWRYLNILEEKLSERIGKPVKVLGGKKVVKA